MFLDQFYERAWKKLLIHKLLNALNTYYLVTGKVEGKGKRKKK